MSDLLMIVPSRGRPHKVAELLEAWRETTTGAAQLLVAVDDDDPVWAGYRTVHFGPPATAMVFGPRTRLGPTLNRLAVERARDHFAIGFMGDDHRPRTLGWDALLVKALRDLGTGLAYGNDLLQGANLPTAVAMTSDIIATLGYMVPPGLIHLYLDDYWLTLGRELGRITYLPDVIVEHLHPVAGKAKWDAGYREVNAPAQYAADRAAYARWLHESLAVEVARLKRMAAA